MVLALTWLLAACAAGVAAIYAVGVLREHAIRFLVGIVGGLAAATTLTYILNIGIPLNSTLIVVETIMLLVLAVGLLWYTGPLPWRGTKLDWVAVAVFAVSFIIFGLIIAPKLFIENKEGYSTGIINAYGDVAWHAANVVMFAEGQTTPPQNPIFAGTNLLYPFMTNFMSGVLLSAGMSLPASINVPAMLMIPVLLTLLYCFAHEFTRSKHAAIIALLLFIFGGATLGISRLPQDFAAADTSIIDFITHLPARDYSGVGTDENGYHFLNPVTTLLLPQRSFLFGISLALCILLLLKPAKQKTDGEYIVAGVLSGLLPLFHGHTVLALLPAIIGLFFLQPRIQQWLLFTLTALVVGIPEVLYYMLGESESGSFFRFEPGWMAGEINPIWYWLKNTGLLLPTVITGFFLKSPKSLKILAGAGLLLFAAANTWLFAPWAWDNFKLFVFFFLFTIPLAAFAALHAIRTFPLIGKIAVIVLLAGHMVSAGVDIFKLTLPTALIWGEWDIAAIQAAEVIKEVTEPGDVIVTAASHNSAVVLAGRPRYLGFAAHVWSHGGDPWDREKAIKEYYQGTLSTLPDLKPKFVLVGPQEESAFAPIAYHPTWYLVAKSGPYFLYSIR
ncbi:MAG: hypothetical protein HYR90_00145 [Candidatus Andersenbacteria bacterium]|nr:hypothetical protein [Candidatus Andersenbacteria bacterium]MBI3251139.1 hypothetical protein [Candidatus Andersenbacteria bacterium]